MARELIAQSGKLAPLVFVLAGIASLTLLVPKTTISVISGALFGTLVGSFLMLLIAVSAAGINYWIGRWWLHGWVQSHFEDPRRFPRLWTLHGLAADADVGCHFLIRLSPIPTALISYTMGASGSRFRPFLLATGLAVLPQMLWVHGGTAVAMDPSSTSAAQWTSVVLAVGAALALSLWIPHVAMTRLNEMPEQSSGANS